MGVGLFCLFLFDFLLFLFCLLLFFVLFFVSVGAFFFFFFFSFFFFWGGGGGAGGFVSTKQPHSVCFSHLAVHFTRSLLGFRQLHFDW